MQPKRIRWMVTLVSIAGALLAAVGATVAIYWDDIFFAILGQQMKLTPTSRSYQAWKENPMPMYLDFYLFNWTNPDDITDPDIKPHFTEMGPYRFRETKEKVNITWNEENSTVSYRQLRRWYFDEDGSLGSLNDTVTTLNTVVASAVYSTRFWSPINVRGLSVGLTVFQQTISVTKSVRELLFEGYEDALLDLANSLPHIETNAPKVDKFGWFYQRNGSTENDGYFNMATGAANMREVGKLMNWNNVSKTEYYPGECGKVRGSAGEFFPPKLTKLDKVTLYSPDLCRTISFDFDETVYIKDIEAYKYSGGSSILDNGTIHKENKCFCTGECQPAGLLNVSTCRYGSPAFISFPHFYLADPYYINAVEGMNPDKEKHNFFMTLEPTAGIPLEVAARFQVNILVSPSQSVTLYGDVQRVFIPVLWFEQHVVLNDEMAGSIRMMLMVPPIGNIVALTIFAIGIVILLWTPVKINVQACFNGHNEQELTKVDSKRIVLNNRRTTKENVCMMPDAEENRNNEINEVQEVQQPLTSHNDLSA